MSSRGRQDRLASIRRVGRADVEVDEQCVGVPVLQPPSSPLFSYQTGVVRDILQFAQECAKSFQKKRKLVRYMDHFSKQNTCIMCKLAWGKTVNRMSCITAYLLR
jgi:hypothetical protein